MYSVNWMLKLPRIQWPDLIMHIPSMFVYYGIWLIGLAAIIAFSHGIVIDMFENIPGMEVTWGVIVAVTAFIAVLAIISDFVANKKEEAVKAKTAKLEGTAYDTVNGEISQKFFWGYPLIAIISAVVVSTVVMFVLGEVAASNYASYVNTEARAILIGCFVAIIAYLFIDKFLLRKVMDGLFFKEVEEPAIDVFLGKDSAGVIGAAVEASSVIAERVKKLKAAGLSEKEIDDVLIASKK